MAQLLGGKPTFEDVVFAASGAGLGALIASRDDTNAAFSNGALVGVSLVASLVGLMAAKNTTARRAALVTGIGVAVGAAAMNKFRANVPSATTLAPASSTGTMTQTQTQPDVGHMPDNLTPAAAAGTAPTPPIGLQFGPTATKAVPMILHRQIKLPS